MDQSSECRLRYCAAAQLAACDLTIKFAGFGRVLSRLRDHLCQVRPGCAEPSFLLAMLPSPLLWAIFPARSRRARKRCLGNQPHLRLMFMSIIAAEANAAMARDQGEWCRTHIRYQQSALQPFVGYSKRRWKLEAFRVVSWALTQTALRASPF
jgi:hypothetical protein